MQEIAEEIGGTGRQLDVTDDDSVDAFVDGLDTVSVLVNNAGGAKGLDPVANADSTTGGGCGRPTSSAACG